MESDKCRKVRRGVSGWLTKKINSVGFYNGLGREIRGLVLGALSDINVKIKELNLQLVNDEGLIPNQSYIRFYMKGGNAFECILDPAGDKATKEGGGDSDWDTQIIIDPWLPIPLQNKAYGLVEDIILEVLTVFGVKIAAKAAAFVSPIAPTDFVAQIQSDWTNTRASFEGKDASRYLVDYDNPQTLRKVYDHETVGLWLDDRRNLADKSISHPEWIPGMIFNDAIKPFSLWRMGYTWRLKNDTSVTPDKVGGIDLYADVGEVKKPVLMELIDVTIPRRNTVEAVEVWESLVTRHIDVSDTQVSVVATIDEVETTTSSERIPLPDIFYHLSEILDMMCEIADGSSKHKDKLPKRIDRFVKIWTEMTDQRRKIQDFVFARIGVSGLDAITFGNEGIYEVDQLISNYIIVTATDRKWENLLAEIRKNDEIIAIEYKLPKFMMRYVAQKSSDAKSNFADRLRITEAALQKMTKSWEVFAKGFEILAMTSAYKHAGGKANLVGANSDDLTLLDFISENGYLQIEKVGFSGVLKGIIIRVENNILLSGMMAQFQALVDAQNAKVSRKLVKDVYRVIKYKKYQVEKLGRYIYECLFVIFIDGKADSFITLTTGDATQIPFASPPNNLEKNFASLEDIARQRKVAAALVDDYLIRTSLKKQYEATKNLITVQ